MSQRVIGYRDGHPVWEDLGPAENVQWGAQIGGQAIVERKVARGEPSSLNAIRTKARRAAQAAS